MRRHVVAAILAGPLAVALSAPALAATGPKRIEGNVVTCAQAGLKGDTLIAVDGPNSDENAIVKGTVHGPDNTLLDVKLLDDDYVITGIVIKGGNAANVYTPPPPFTGLTSPTNDGDNVAAISHWFVCGEKAPSPSPSGTSTPTEAPTSTDAPTPTATAGPADMPAQTDDVSSESQQAASTVPVPTAVPAGQNNPMAVDLPWGLVSIVALGGLSAVGVARALRRRDGHDA